MAITSIKVSFNGELRRLPFPIDESDDQFSLLARSIAKSFGIPRCSFILQYVDHENDTVTVGSQLELTAAIEAISGAVLRLTVVQRNPAASADMAVVDDSPADAPADTTQCPPLGHDFGWKHHGGGCRQWPAHGQQLQEQYREQLQVLKSEGLNCGFWAARVLSNVNGDLAAAREIINSRHNNTQRLLQKYASQLAALASAGITVGRGGANRDIAHSHCAGKVLHLLERFAGDVAQVIAHLKANEGKLAQMQQRYAVQLEQLRAQGFTAEGHCLRVLHKFDGDVSKAVQRLSKCHQAPTAAGPADHAEQLQLLRDKGYPAPMCAHLLRKFGGDVARVEQALQQRKQWCGGDHHRKRHQYKEAKKRYAAEIAQLKEMGFRCKWSMVPLLIQHNGDMTAVTNALMQAA